VLVIQTLKYNVHIIMGRYDFVNVSLQEANIGFLFDVFSM